MMTHLLQRYSSELQKELSEILKYWMQYTPDEKYGGFYGKIDHANTIDETAPRGAVLNARILWSFAAAYNCTGNVQYLPLAHRAYKYINQYFIDTAAGGTFWSVNFKGEPADTKKQVYAIAFLLYAYSEYYQSTQLEDAKRRAIGLYHLIEQYSFDSHQTGYLEAFTRDWQPIGDLRLSSKDANEKKTMNTHLHILEAYTNLYRIWPDEKLHRSIVLLINNFTSHIIDKNTWHLNLFFNETWQVKSHIISYGHDIEAAWLLLEAAAVTGDASLIEDLKEIAVNLANAAIEGLDTDGGMWYEKDGDHLVKQKHWWPQAEAMIGFYNTWQITGNQQYLQHSVDSWEFIKKSIKATNGEWIWGLDEHNQPMQQEDKVGLWKCPYHNSRACMELFKRINTDL
ncbi:AGE family epimerase/isomerase [Ferruginibacter paludis]|uniref:AGE family epimerase/isomerase n=1 Tax=Ferruginibacter paludis TaxID=1310417 RepID=UPI0025B36B20|nr:AGE family epimerase/isomerase [Ferruginibacter paludis]MDN3658768.1 AGE family epimerase/isomerase [Ferruginibacter paludis]